MLLAPQQTNAYFGLAPARSTRPHLLLLGVAVSLAVPLGPLTLGELIAVALLATAAVRQSSREKPDATAQISVLAVPAVVVGLWLAGVVLSALVNELSNEVVLANLGRPILFLLGIGLASTVDPTHYRRDFGLIAMGGLAGSIAVWVLRFSGVNGLDFWLKYFGYAFVGLGLLAAVTRREGGVLMTALAVPLVVVVGVWSDARYAMLAMLAALVLPVLLRVSWGRSPAARVAVLASSFVAAATLLPTLLRTLATSGTVNAQRRLQQVTEAGGSLDVLVAVRPDALLTASVALERPWLGWGQPPLSSDALEGLQFLLMRQVELNATALQDSVPVHSFLLGEWLRGGILAVVPLVLLLAVALYRIIRRLMVETSHWHRAFYTWLAITISWELLFSGLSDRKRLLMGFLFGVAWQVRVAHRHADPAP